MTSTSPRSMTANAQGYFDITPRSSPDETADRDPEVSRKEKAKRRYSLDMYQHTMGMWQTTATDLKCQRSGSISSTTSNGSYGPLSSAGSNGSQDLAEEKGPTRD